MALTPSSMMPLGTKAPYFYLKDVLTGNEFSPESLKKEKGLVVMFICVHCPYVIHVQDELKRIADEYLKRGVGFVAISSNDVEKYPQDSPEHMTNQAQSVGFNFPYLYDESQQTARDYQAECTPDLYLFDHKLECVYRGRLDESRPKNEIPVTGKDLRAALDSLLNDRQITQEQFPSAGCNIKWK